MIFRTIVSVPTYPFHIGYHQKGLMLGSCFAASVGERLIRRKMPVTVNPFGIVYNPLSVIQTLESIGTGHSICAEDLREHQGLWFSFSHHGSFASPDKAEALNRINHSIIEGHKALKECDYLIITLGTAWVYEWIESGKVVNNCHKLPASGFRRFRLEPDEIVHAFDRLLNQPLYQKKNIILTVSPIRHLKDGAIENQASKAVLLTAVHQLVEKHNHVHYFPSYEIMMDDLRDYRFYEADMVHPSEIAVNYIWERFCKGLVCEPAQKLFKRIEKITAARHHRPFNPDTQQHQAFKDAMLHEISELKNQYPFLDFSEETHYFSE